MNGSEGVYPLGGEEPFDSSGEEEPLGAESAWAEEQAGIEDEAGGSDSRSAQDDDVPGSSRRSASGGGVDVQVDVKEAKDSRIEVTGTRIDGQYQAFFAGFGSAELPWRQHLAPEDFDLLGKEQLDRIDSAYVVSDADVDLVVNCAERHRMAIVVGERGLGKGVLSQVAAARVAERDTSVRQVLLAGSLDRSLRVRPEALFEDRSSFARSIVVLEDAFDRGNEDLCRLMERLSPPRLEALARRLRAAQSYLLLTSATERLPVQLDGLLGSGVLARLEPPTVEALVQALHRRVRHRFPGAKPSASERPEKVERLLESRSEWLASRLRTLPRVVFFIDSLLEPVTREELSLEEAVERLDDLEYWLLSELPEDRPVWCFVLALVLASTDPRSPWVPWSRLFRIWREVEEHVDSELGREKDAGPRPMSRLIVGRSFLDRARAEVRRRPYPMGEAVRFKDPTLGERLWRVLLGGGRSVLASLSERLEKLARSSEPGIAVLAARALGRIGELDPRGGVLARIDGYLNVEEDEERLRRAFFVGEMLVGASSSEDRAYFSGLLDRLRAATGGPSGESAEGAVLALVPLGVVEGELVLDHLWGVIRGRAARPAEAAARVKSAVDRRIEALAESHRRASGKGPVVRLDPRAVESAALQTLGERQSRILGAVQFALVGLAFAGETTRVLESIARWMRSNEGNLAPWLALLTLRTRGLLRVLEGSPVRPPVDTEKSTERPGTAAAETHSCSRILVAAEGEEEIAHVTGLLDVAYGEVGSFPRILRSHLRRNLVRVLEGWMKQAARSDLARARAVALLPQLLETGCEELRGDVFRLVRTTADGQKDELRDVALEILRAGTPAGAMTVAASSG